MKIPKQTIETDSVIVYLRKRQLLPQYRKAKVKLLQWNISGLDFKLRKPNHLWIMAFRINKQFRAVGYFESDIFIVTMIDNHQ